MLNYSNEFLDSKQQIIQKLKLEVEFLNIMYEYNLQMAKANNSLKLTSLAHSLNIINQRYSKIIDDFIRTVNKYVKTPISEIELLSRNTAYEINSESQIKKLKNDLKEKDLKIIEIKRDLKKAYKKLSEFQTKTQTQLTTVEICINLLKSPNFLKKPTNKLLEISCHNIISESAWQQKFSRVDFLSVLLERIDKLIDKTKDEPVNEERKMKNTTTENMIAEAYIEDYKYEKTTEFKSKIELYNYYRDFIVKRMTKLLIPLLKKNSKPYSKIDYTENINEETNYNIDGTEKDSIWQ